jgi:hypothetical protein
VRNFRTATAVVAALALAACQTANTANAPAQQSAWAIDQTAQKCMQALIGGALLGGILGAATGGGRNAARGAMIGAAAGGAMCVVIAALDSQDRERIRNAQLEAARTEKEQLLSYQGQDGLERKISVKPARKVIVKKDEAGKRVVVGEATKKDDLVQVASKGQEICIEVLTSAAIETKGVTDVPTQTVCHEPDGTLVPAVVASAT